VAIILFASAFASETTTNLREPSALKFIFGKFRLAVANNSCI
jgi:hypothetical protein